MAIFDGGKMFKAIRKLSNFLGLGIPDKIDSIFLPKTPDKKGFKLQRQGSSNPIPVVYGEQMVGGIIVHKYVKSSEGKNDNRYLYIVVVFCEGEIESIDELFFNGVSENDKRFEHKNGDKWYAASKLEGTVSQGSTLFNEIPNWSSNHQLSGLACACVRFEQDKDQTIWSGEPRITARVKGRKIYDPRNGTTSYSTNPALVLRDYITNPIYGKGLPESRVVDSLFITAANNCDIVVSNVTETLSRSYYDPETKTYVNQPPTTTVIDITKHTCNITIDTSRTIMDNVKEICGTFRAIIPPNYNVWPVSEEAGSPVFEFNDDNIISDFSIQTKGINERFNSVTIRFPDVRSPKMDDNEATWPPKDSAIHQQFLGEDNGKILDTTLDFPGINNMAEAQQMAEFICKRSRFGLRCSFDAAPESLGVQVGDIVGVTNPENGFVNKPFRVEDKAMIENGNLSFSLREHENSIYPWGDKAYTDRDGGTWLGDPSDIEAPQNLTFTPDLSLSSAGTLSWDADDNLFTRFNLVKVYKTADENGTAIDPAILALDYSTIANYVVIPVIERGTYSFEVQKESTIGSLSDTSSLSVIFTNPAVPDSITIIPDNFSLEVIPVLNNAGVGTNFEYALNNTATVRGRGGSHTFAGLLPNTAYTVYVRTINAYGVSPWLSQSTTTLNDGGKITDIIGTDIADIILPDVITAVESDLQQIVDDALVNYPTRTEVSNEINTAISTVSSAFNEDPKADLLDTINNIVDNFETEGNVKTESLERKTQVNQLTASINENNARITEINTVVTDLDSATAAQFTALEARVGNNESSIVSVNLAVSDLDSATTQQFTQLTATVGGNTAQITSNQTAIATETSTRATQVQQLQAADQGIISRLDTVEADSSGNASAISALEGSVNNPVTGLSATYNIASIAIVDSQNNGLAINTLEGQVNDPLNNTSALFGFTQQAQTTADGNTVSITALQNKVDDPVNGLSATFFLASQAKTTADGNAQSIAGLNTSVADAQGDATSALTLASQLDGSLSEYRATAQLKVDANGNVGFIQLDATPTNSTIAFQANQVIFKDGNGGNSIYFDNTSGVYIFNGTLESVNGTFTGELVAANGTFTGTLQGAGGTFNGNVNGVQVNSSLMTCTGKITCQDIESTRQGTFYDIDVNNQVSAQGAPLSLGCLYGGHTGSGSGVEAFSYSGTFAFYARRGGYGPFTGSHQGLVDKSFKAEPGDIVCDVELINIADISNAILKAEVSTRKEQRNVTGVFVGKHEINKDNLPVGLGGYKGDLSSYDIIGFNALGEGVINVCGEGGDIEAGDYICSSSTKGKAMKQFDQDFKRPYTIAKARHSIKFNSSDEVKQIAVKYLEG